MKTITIEDKRRFRLIVDVCNDALGLNYRACQRSIFRPAAFKEEFGNKYVLWCTREHINGKAALEDYGWVNKLSEDGKTFIEYNENPDKTKKYIDDNPSTLPLRVGFMYLRGSRGFKFIGVFKYLGTDEKVQRVYKRVSEKFPM
jgi:hypothetical protein